MGKEEGLCGDLGLGFQTRRGDNGASDCLGYHGSRRGKRAHFTNGETEDSVDEAFFFSGIKTANNSVKKYIFSALCTRF